MENIIIGIVVGIFIISFFAMLSFKRWIEYKEYKLSLEHPKQTNNDNPFLWKTPYITKTK